MALNEPKIVRLLCLIHFINICDYMMVMPLGPDYMVALGSTNAKMGLIASAYSFAAAAAGFIASFVLDRYERKAAILHSLLGLIISTAVAALSFNLQSMIIARLIAGAFGGLLTALTLSMVTDLIPTERRGAAIGKVMSAFSIAAFLGVPFGLETSKILGWRAPFLILSIFAFGVWLICLKHLPQKSNQVVQVDIKSSIIRVKNIVFRKTSLITLPIMMLSMIGMFAIVPNVSAHFQLNLSFPRSYLSILYLLGGFASFFTMRLVGVIVDIKGSFCVVLISYFLMAFSLCFGFIFYPSIIPSWIIFMSLMVAASARNIAIQTLSSKVPSDSERGTYFAINNMLQSLGASLGAYLASLILYEQNGKLLGMDKVGIASLIIASIIPFLISYAANALKK